MVGRLQPREKSSNEADRIGFATASRNAINDSNNFQNFSFLRSQPVEKVFPDYEFSAGKPLDSSIFSESFRMNLDGYSHWFMVRPTKQREKSDAAIIRVMR